MRIPTVVLLSAILLFLTGVLLGAFTGSKRVISEVFPWLQSTRRELEATKAHVESLERDLILLTLTERQIRCGTTKLLLQRSWEDLSKFWNILPYRIEAEEVPEDLLKEYYGVSVRAWILASYYWRECNSSGKVPTLYIIKRGDVNAGKLLDKYQDKLLIFVTELNTGIPLSDALLETYMVKKAPSLIICGAVVPVEEEAIQEVLRECAS